MIEFALVLPVLLFITVGTVYYGFVFVIEMAIENAARQAAVAATAVAPTSYASTGEFKQAVRVVVDRVAQDNLDWLPGTVLAGFTNSSVAEATDVCFPGDECAAPGTICQNVSVIDTTQVGCVYITFEPSNSDRSVLPQISLPPFGAIPPLPTSLSGVAEVLL